MALFVVALVLVLWTSRGVWLGPRFQEMLQARFEQAHPPKAPKLALPVPRAAAPSESADTTPVADYFQRLGQTGDLFGAVNALFAACTVAGVFWAGALQRTTMRETRRFIEQERFETAFFEILRLTREVIDLFAYQYQTSSARMHPHQSLRTRLAARTVAIDWKAIENSSHNLPGWRLETARGYAALNAIAAIVFQDLRLDQPDARERIEVLVSAYKQLIYRPHASNLGPYFRLLFQAFDLVAKAPLEDAMKIRYAKIARGQISEGAVLLLALNGLTWRGHDFIELIKRFGLLEHMHPSYLDSYKDDLVLVYQQRAFLGSKDRAESTEAQTSYLDPFSFDSGPGQPGFQMSRPFDNDVTGPMT